MKHFFFLLTLTALGSSAAIAAPFWGVLLYYGLATLRPQYLWHWALSGTPDVRWSLTAAFVALVATALHLPTLIRNVKVNKVIILVGVYAALMLMSMLTAFNTRVAGYWAEEYGKVFLMMFLATLVIQRLWQVQAMGLMIVLCLGYIAYEVNYLYFMNGGRLDIYHKGYGGLDNNGAGMLLALGIPFAYWLFAAKGETWITVRRAIAALIGVLLIHSVMMTYSRGAMLAAAAGLVWIVLHHRPRFQAGAMAVAVLIGISVMAGPEIRERFQSTGNFRQDESAQLRFESWSAAWDMAWASPLLGKGIRNSNYYSQNYGADRAGRTIHNQYLQVAADSGIPAAACYVGMLGVGYLGLSRARKACLDQTQEIEDGDYDPDPSVVARVHSAGTFCMALQTSLVMFALTGMFLSVELVELPWLLIAMSGLAPVAVQRYLDRIKDGVSHGEDEDEDEDDAPPHQLAPPPTPSSRAA